MDDNETRPLDAATEPIEPLDRHDPIAPTPVPTAAVRESAPAFLRRHAVGVGVAAALLAVILVAGGTAWGVSAAVASTHPTVSAPAHAQSAGHGTGSAAAKAAKRKKAKAHGARGTLTDVGGDTWTLHAASGKTLTVKITSTTAFGTKKASANRDSFATGDRVGVLGKRSGDTITATRIVHLPLHAHTAKPSPAPSA